MLSPSQDGLGLILTSNANSPYGDVTGVSYDYPTQYRRQIAPGRRFVYYRSTEGRQAPVYFGAGVIGPIHVSPYDRSRLECDILDHRPFERPVPFKDPSGITSSPMEVGEATSNPVHALFQNR